MQKSLRLRIATIVLVVGILSPAPRVHAQMAEEEAVIEVVHDLFDGMREKDADKIRGTFAPGARLGALPQARDSVRYTDAGAFAMSIGRFERTVDERIWDWEVHIDGNLATVWTKYDVLVDGDFSHCGIDAFQLFHMGDGWKIFHLADTRHTGSDCWRYPGE